MRQQKSNLLGNDADLLCRRRAVATQLLNQHDKLVPAQPGHCVHLAHTGLDALRHLDQQQIPGRVAVGVVQRFEVVQVQHDQCGKLAIALAGGQRLAHAVGQQAAVGQIGERVVKRQTVDLFVRALALGDVAHSGHIAHDFARLVGDGGCHHNDGKALPIFTHKDQLKLTALATQRLLKCGADVVVLFGWPVRERSLNSLQLTARKARHTAQGGIGIHRAPGAVQHGKPLLHGLNQIARER